MDNLGEVIVTTESNSDIKITQGFEQPAYNFKITREYDCGELIDETANAFVPNSADKYSNKWIIDLFFYEQNSINTVTIFNRWGDVIKTIENYDNISAYWDGTNTNDQPMPSGTYFFTIEVPSEQIRCSNWVQIVKEKLDHILFIFRNSLNSSSAFVKVVNKTSLHFTIDKPIVLFSHT